MIDLLLLIMINITSGVMLYWVIRLLGTNSDRAIRTTLVIVTSIVIACIVLVNYMVLDIHYIL